MQQDLKNKAGEIKFRAKLFEQQVAGASELEGELSSKQMLAEMRRRMEITRNEFKELAAEGVLQEPFLELGAERGQRSLVLANDYGLKGYAADLSFDSLRYTDFLAEQDKLQRMPQRVCCDAYKLPFADNSIGFAFCYQTLHHFPTPAPIFQELYRVLKPGAILHVNEEPIQRTWKLPLWKRHVTPKTGTNKYLRYAKDYLLDFVSEPHVTEVDYGICENDDISLRQWEAAFGEAARKQVQLKLLPIPQWMSRVEHNTARWGMRSVMCQGLGGILRASIMPKAANTQAAVAKEPLCCPVCRSGLVPQAGGFFCSTCKQSYPTRSGILMLLPPDELQNLYPEPAVASNG
jgi:ubiquinone/menaquinone biosynthesis C-methylase UbiE/uncharacterized protein YbaR (Trm112 family)